MSIVRLLARAGIITVGVLTLMSGCVRPTIVGVDPASSLSPGIDSTEELPPSDVPAPFAPSALTCEIHPLGNSAGNPCTLTPSIPADPEGRAVTYVNAGSSCPSVSVNSTTGNVTFTAPAKAAVCVIAVKASNGSSLSRAITSETITGQNNIPATPSSLTCPLSPVAGTTGISCTLLAAVPSDIDGDSLAYSDGGSTCPGTAVNATNGSATFTAPAKGATCVVKVKAYDGMDFSGAASSAIITGASQAPNVPNSLSCVTNPLAKSIGNVCTLSAAIPGDNDGDPVTYSDGGSTCAAVVVDAGTGNATFTAPNKGATCLVKVRAFDGMSYSTAVSSSTITGVNNAPATPSALSCATTPLAKSTANACTLTAAVPADVDGDTITYSNDGSTCTGVVVNPATGSATFTAPLKGATCVVKVRAYDGTTYSSAVSSATITGQNNTPAQPSSISCPLTPIAGSAGNACTLSAATPVDIDGDFVTYSDGGSTCAAVSVNGSTGNATFTAPTKGATCVVKVKANDGTANSVPVSSATITAQNNAPTQPASLSCPANPPAGSTGNVCTLTAASPADSDGDSVTYVDDSSTCAAVVVTSATGAVTFTAPTADLSCAIRVKAYDGIAYSSAIVSNIGAGNNPPNQPAALNCPTTPLAQSTGNTCTLTAANPVDGNGDPVTYSDDGSTCAAVSVNSGTGNTTFTAPSRGTNCVVKVRAHDGQAYSSAVSSSTITGQNNPPTTPSSLSCNTTPLGGSTGNTCTLTAASPVDKDGDTVTYSDDGSTCLSVVVNGTTGNATFTAPPDRDTCVVRVRSHDGTTYSGTVSSATITGQTNAPNQPTSISCATTPLAGSTLNSCTLTAATPADPDGQSVTYHDDGSTCGSVVVNNSTGAVTFTAPAKTATCVVKIKAYDGALYSTPVTSATITGQNNAPNQPSAIACTTTPVALSTANTCTLTAATPRDGDGDSVTYSDDGSSCAAVSVNSTTGNATFTAPAKGATCLVKVRAHDGTAYSTAVSSATITGQNRAPNTPTSLVCAATSPLAKSTGNTCTLTAASPVDLDGDPVTYSDGGSTCPAVSVNSSTGNATYTAPSKNVSCVMKVRAHDGVTYSGAVTSATITARNNAPSTPAAVSCNTTPLGGSTGNTCTVTAASPADLDGDTVTYSDGGSSCGGVSVSGTTVTFTAPAKGFMCVVRVNANDGAVDSPIVNSSTIWGQNNPPRTPAALVCPATPIPGSTGNTCTLTAASPADLDGDAVTYANDGSTCAAASVSADGSAITFTAPASGATCVMKVKAHDGTAYSSTVSSATIGQVSCPTNFIAVPGNPTYGTSEFCVAKFPMKGVNSSGNLVFGGEGSGTWSNGSGTWELVQSLQALAGGAIGTAIFPASRPDGTPWTNITRDEAITACAAMGAGYHLLTNAEWQTIARNIENTASNWSGGSVGSGMLNRGQSDNSLDVNALAQGFLFNAGNSFSASILALASCGGVNCSSVAFNDGNGYAGTGNNSGQLAGSGWEQKRTHTLSNGGIIWDLAGNVWQWVADTNSTMFGADRHISQLTAATNPTTGTIGGITGNAKLLFGPAGTFTALGSSQYGGLGFAYINYNAGGILRGGDWRYQTGSGVFTAHLGDIPAAWDEYYGFRCAK